MVGPTGPWMSGTEPFYLDTQFQGSSASHLDSVETKNQVMSAAVNLIAFKLGTDENSLWDFYAVNGIFKHGVEGFGSNWASVGYYATHMSLELAVVTEGAKYWDAGPDSTVGTSTTTWSLGGDLSGGVFGGAPILQAGINAGWEETFSTASVTIGTSFLRGDASTEPTNVEWQIGMPDSEITPEPPSSSGWELNLGAIWATPITTGFAVRVRPQMKWEYRHPRGTTEHTQVWAPPDDPSNLLTYVAPPATPPSFSEV